MAVSPSIIIPLLFHFFLFIIPLLFHFFFRLLYHAPVRGRWMQGDEPTSGLKTMSLGRHGDRSSFTDYGEVVIGSPDPVRDSHAEDGKVGGIDFVLSLFPGGSGCAEDVQLPAYALSPELAEFDKNTKMKR